ncbi:Gfo/Idh/MocA family oxidoreductase [Chelativorans sp. AA-79]|uniref:Gfo/Idh/MocA family protein n=1 Tax=Chelativorans sp. AA-79 TaxID=3028735 RepID=UPI0023F813E7|nr:Gfo/Idh/MocA family oxidoreductase [Chelativorans sp. AA-79]WEX07783.1 Gfo/Idh/MocA family oxidoreductase [Chelativorans sp. AA-79]
MATKIAVVGIGKIARDQHLPSIGRSAEFELAAAVSRHGRVEGIDNYTNLETMLRERPDIPAVALCVPPVPRYEMAVAALKAGRHVLLEKPPGTTVGEVEALIELARRQNVTLFATWHSRFAPCVEPARTWLEGKQIRHVEIVWKEDVRRWHPGQDWIWEAGGFGVFDPGINALSILTAIVPPVFVTAATLETPENCQTPIAAKLAMRSLAGFDVAADFDWRQEGPQTWEIRIETDQGLLVLADGGSRMSVDGGEHPGGLEAEYDGIYHRFAALLKAGEGDVDLAPHKLVADAFLLGRKVDVGPFHE